LTRSGPAALSSEEAGACGRGRGHIPREVVVLVIQMVAAERIRQRPTASYLACMALGKEAEREDFIARISLWIGLSDSGCLFIGPPAKQWQRPEPGPVSGVL
jgi:hypothetical protein